MAHVFVDSYTAAHQGQVSEADLASRSYAQSEAAWIRGMREIQAARGARAAHVLGAAPGTVAAGAEAGPEQRGRDADATFYVAEDERGDIVGVAVSVPARTERQESTIPEEWLQEAGEVSALYVHVNHQREGIGRKLVQAIAAQHVSEGRQRLVIGVLAVNAPARRFYGAIGGQLIGQFLEPDEDGSMLTELMYGWADARTLLG